MKKILLSICAIGMIVLTSCTKYPDEADRIMEDLVIYTQYDTKIDFHQFGTFAIADKVRYVDDGDSSYLESDNSQELLDKVATNMIACGYTEVAIGQNPDLAIEVVAYKTTNTTVYYPYYPYYGGGYWYGYGYYSYPYVSSYSVGSVVIDMYDLKNVGADKKVYVRWEAFIRGLMTGAHTKEEISKSVDQAFTQTPALKIN